MFFREENFKFHQIYCDIPTGFGEISQRYIDWVGVDDSISTEEPIIENIDENINKCSKSIDWLDYRQLAEFSNDAKALLGEVIFDESNRRYQLKSIIVDNPEMTIYQSSDDFLIYVYKASPRNRDEYIDAFDHLMSYTKVSHIVLPMAVLDEPYIGYVASNKLNGYRTLEEHLMKELIGDENFEAYHKETDGLFKRYKIASLMAKFLEEIHCTGYCLGDILPTEILVSPNKDSIVFMNANRLMRLPKHEYSDLEKLFIAPELQDKCWRFDSLTDTYSLFKIIRYMLFPVMNNTIPQTVIEQFGDENVVEILLDDTKMGDRYQRHCLSDIRDACLIASKRLYRCPQCKSWILAHLDAEEECIWCHNKISQIAGARFFEYVVSGDIIPEDKVMKSYANKIGEMVFKQGKQTIDYRQLTKDAVGTTEKIPIAGIRYYPDGSITLVNLSNVALSHDFMDGKQKKRELIKPKTDREIEVDVYRGNSRIYYNEEELSNHGFDNSKVYQFFTIH